MTLSFANSPGNLFNRLGKCGAIVKDVKSFQTTLQTIFTDPTTGLGAQLDTEPDIQAIAGNSYLGALASPESASSIAKQVAEQVVNRMVYRDNPQLNQTLTSSNTLSSLNEIIRQMKVEGASVLAMTIGSSITNFTSINTNTGNSALNVSTKRPLDGRVLENCFAETITVVCSADSYLNNATAGNETLQLSGTGSESDFFGFDWPQGSNAFGSLSNINGNANNTQGNILTNSGFETWTSNTPNNWTIVVGTAGTQVFQESSLNYDGVASLRLLGDGSTLTQLTQTLNSSTGSVGTVSPLSQYSVCLFLRRDGIAPAAGVLTVDFIDGNNNIIQDASGANNSFTVDLTQLTTIYTPYTGVFRTPLILPSTYKIRFRLSTALTNGRSVYLDKMSMGQMTQLYTSGPFFASHAGSLPLVRGDYCTCAITNSRGSGGTLSTWQTLLCQLFSNYVLGNEILFPSSSSPTIADSLIG